MWNTKWGISNGVTESLGDVEMEDPKWWIRNVGHKTRDPKCGSDMGYPKKRVPNDGPKKEDTKLEAEIGAQKGCAK